MSWSAVRVKRNLCLCCFLFIVISLVACANKQIEKVVDHGKYEELDTVSYSLEEKIDTTYVMLQRSYATAAGITMKIVEPEIIQSPVKSIVVELCNERNIEGGTGDWYSIQRLYEDRVWKELPLDRKYHDPEKPMAVVWFMSLAILSPHECRKMSLSPYIYDPNIESGIYRIAKTFSFPSTSSEKEDTVYVEFEIR